MDKVNAAIKTLNRVCRKILAQRGHIRTEWEFKQRLWHFDLLVGIKRIIRKEDFICEQREKTNRAAMMLSIGACF